MGEPQMSHPESMLMHFVRCGGGLIDRAHKAKAGEGSHKSQLEQVPPKAQDTVSLIL